MITSSESWPTGPSSKRRSWTSVSSATAWHTSASWGWEAVYNISEHWGKPPSWCWWKTPTFGQCFLRSKPLEVPNLQVQGSSIPFGLKPWESMIESSESWLTGPSSERWSWASVSSATAWHSSACWEWESVYTIQYQQTLRKTTQLVLMKRLWPALLL